MSSTTLTCEPLNLPNRKTWTRAEFMRMADLGLFADEKFELIEGEITKKMTQNGPHVASIYKTQEVLNRVFGKGYMVRSQAPLALGAANQPEPDVAVVIGSVDDYTPDHPTTALLVVEVSHTTLAQDRAAKAGLYARAGIQEYWIVNISDRVLEVHREPAAMAEQPLGHHYRSITRHTDATSIAPLAAPDAIIAIADLLPQKP